MHYTSAASLKYIEQRDKSLNPAPAKVPKKEPKERKVQKPRGNTKKTGKAKAQPKRALPKIKKEK